MKDDKIIAAAVKKYSLRLKKRFLERLESEERILIKMETRYIKSNDSEE